MPYKRIKDTTNLIERWKIKSILKPYYFHVYLWKDLKSMKENSLDADTGNIVAIVNLSNSIIEIYKDGTEKKIVSPKLGEIHFVSKLWGVEIIAHEVIHVMIQRLRMLEYPTIQNLINQDKTNSGENCEEIICYEVGRWIEEIYYKLLELDYN